VKFTTNKYALVCVCVVCLMETEICTEMETEMAIGRTVKYISYLDDEITKSMTTKEEVFVYVCVRACVRGRGITYKHRPR
jgi:hypothetical protein